MHIFGGSGLMPFKILHFPLVFFRGRFGFEGP